MLKVKKRSLYLWNLMIRNSTDAGRFSEALELYSSMLRTGLHANDFTFPLLLKACSNLDSILDGSKLHSNLLQLGFHHVFVLTALLDMYSKCNDLPSSRKVFDEMPVRTTVSWNSMISAYCRCSLIDEAILTLQEMRLLGFRPTSATLLSFLPACLLRDGLSIQCYALKLGLVVESSGVPLINSIMKMYVEYRHTHEARSIFDMMGEKSVVSWTTIIGGYMNIGDIKEAFTLFNQMRTSTIPDFVVFITLISGSGQAGILLTGSSVHCLLLKHGFDSKDPINNLLVTMYAKCGDLISAQRAFHTAHEKSPNLWTSMIAGYTHLGYPLEALQLFRTMLREAIIPHEATLAVILSACADLGSLTMGEEIEEYILSNGFQSNVQVQTSLIHMFSRCGSIEKAKAAFERLSTRDLAAWSSMINGYAIHGMAHEALGIFHKMQNVEGLKPDAGIFTSILVACSHSGLIKDGMRFFQSMEKDFGIQPNIEHFTCLVDLLGRGGQLEFAFKTIESFPAKVQAQSWATLLSACRKHHKLELGELAAKKLFNSNPDSVGNYIVMANLYTSSGKWNEAAMTRKLIEDRGLVKEPGWSYIDINGSVHVFLAGDQSHKRSDEIYSKLEELNVKMLESGHVPGTDGVIHDLEEEEKGESLKVHSERLAIALGLISTETGTTLTIIKNMRTCDDCHSALKYISKITGRLLIVRDTQRFHHFKSGSCSCKDFW